MKKVFIIFVVLLFCGCASKDMDELAIVSAVGIELENDSFVVTTQIINIKKSLESNSSSDNFIFQEKGKTIYEALKNISTRTSKKVYLPHSKLLIIDKELIEKDKLKSVIDFFLRDIESMLNYYILVTDENTPSDILKTQTPFVSDSSQFIYKSLQESEKAYAIINTMTFEKLVSDLKTPGINPVFTKVSLNNEKNIEDESEMLESSYLDTYIVLGNIMILNKNKQLVELSKQESISLNIIKNSIKPQSSITLNCGENYFTLTIDDAKTKMKFIQNKVVFNTNLSTTIGDYNCEYDLNDMKSISILENISKKQIGKNILSVLNISQEYENDFIGIGKFINGVNKNFFKKNKDKWDNGAYKKLTFEPIVKIVINLKGNLKNNLLKGDINE